MSDLIESIPICECATAWPGQGHHPECPVRNTIERLTREIEDALRSQLLLAEQCANAERERNEARASAAYYDENAANLNLMYVKAANERDELKALLIEARDDVAEVLSQMRITYGPNYKKEMQADQSARLDQIDAALAARGEQEKDQREDA